MCNTMLHFADSRACSPALGETGWVGMSQYGL